MGFRSVIEQEASERLPETLEGFTGSKVGFVGVSGGHQRLSSEFQVDLRRVQGIAEHFSGFRWDPRRFLRA